MISHGRSDDVLAHVPVDGYVLPADVVSSLGMGSSSAGLEFLSRIAPTRDTQAPMTPALLSRDEFVAAPEDLPALARLLSEVVGVQPADDHYETLEEIVTRIRGGDRRPYKGL